MQLDENIAAKIANAKGVILDMDGTIALGDKESGGHKALPGALDLLSAFRRRNIPFRAFTNGTASSPATYAGILRAAGFELDDGEFMTPSSSTARWLSEQGIGKVRVLGTEDGSVPLIEAGIEVVGPRDEAEGVEAVYTAWFRTFSYPDLEAACHSVWDGAQLVSASHVPFFATEGGRGIGTSFAINTMITALTDVEAKVLGKPSQVAFDAALASMGLAPEDAPAVVVFGDDPLLEAEMARNAGAVSVAMTTGLTDAESFAALPEAKRPHLILDSLEPLIPFLK
ncbi:HAD-IIA family hydrolase [Parasphingopyxis marina]|uniref:HAD-IIA family hydrolase n=1 Tax=Parasphingopyxis marina TaxID=2761622 RepID=UPI002E2B1737|nr:HAD hydrolase-like protein [Parasphingopyxis marina]